MIAVSKIEFGRIDFDEFQTTSGLRLICRFKIDYNTINARVETVDTAPSYRLLAALPAGPVGGRARRIGERLRAAF
jgi:hypothetical protein